MSLNSDEVAQYLLESPEFFEEHPDLLTRLVLPHPHGGRTISITERQMIDLREKNKALVSKLGELIQFGEDNDAISEKMHRLAVGLVAASTFQAVIHVLDFHLEEDFACPTWLCAFGTSPRGWGNCPNSPPFPRNFRSLPIPSPGPTVAPPPGSRPPPGLAKPRPRFAPRP